MMLDIDFDSMRAQFIRYLPLGLVIVFIMFLNIFLVLGPQKFGLQNIPKPIAQPLNYSNTAEIGSQLYTVYFYQFEIAAVILLVAIVAAIRLTLRRRNDLKYLSPAQQVKVGKGINRLRLVSMLSEESLSRSSAEMGDNR